MQIDQNHRHADAWLKFLGVKERPHLFQIYLDMPYPGEIEITLFSRNGGEIKYRHDYAGFVGVKQIGETRPATEACDEVDWDRLRDEVWVTVQ